MRPEREFTPDVTAAALDARHEGAAAEDVLAAALRLWPGRVAVVSSFGAEAAVLLHMVARLDPATPVLLLDTEMLFPQTLAYQEALSAHLGLRDVRRIATPRGELRRRDPWGALHLTDPDACCAMRKVAPLARALAPFAASVTGRKRHQAPTRAALSHFEADGARIRVNPLARWPRERVAAYMDEHALPRHPLVARGYPSIGCMPCTSRVGAGEDARAGRWRGSEKVECGIHGPSRAAGPEGAP